MNRGCCLRILKTAFWGIALIVLVECLSLLIAFCLGYNKNNIVLRVEDLVKEKDHDMPPGIDEVLLTDNTVLKMINETHHNVVVAHLDDVGPHYNATCGYYVNPLDIHYNNVYWQMQRTKNETYYLFGAYYDERPLAGGRMIRIVAMIDQYKPTENATCILWYGNDVPAASKASYQFMWYENWGYKKEALFPYLVSCEIPTGYGNRLPDSVTLVVNPCERATNNLKLVYNPPPKEGKKDFIVCVKGLNFNHDPIMAVRLVEWIELLKILGADKIVLYELNVHENITQILKYYQEKGSIEVRKTFLPGHFANIAQLMATYLRKRIGIQLFQEMIHYNDCFYRNIYKYRYVVLHDVDEVIVPRGEILTWQQLVEVTKPKAVASRNLTYASFYARNSLFMDEKKGADDWYPDIPKYMHMLQHVTRNKEHERPGFGVKAFHNTDLILSLHNHFPRACIGDPKLWCPNFEIDIADGLLQHYCFGTSKHGCKTQNKDNLTFDSNIWKYNTMLIREVKKTLRATGFLPQQ